MQQLNPSEISDLTKQRIEKLDVSAEARQVGTVVAVSDGIVRIHGPMEVMYGELTEFEGNSFGMALELDRACVRAVPLGDQRGGVQCKSCEWTGRTLEVPVGPAREGRVVDALGKPMDGTGAMKTELTD